MPFAGSISVATLLNNQAALSLSTSNNTIKIQGANNLALVTVANIRAGRSIIHIIDAVLVPSLPETTYPTIARVAKAYGLSTLVTALASTPLLSAVTNVSTAVTVFAPTNEVGDRWSMLLILNSIGCRVATVSCCLWSRGPFNT